MFYRRTNLSMIAIINKYKLLVVQERSVGYSSYKKYNRFKWDSYNIELQAFLGSQLIVLSVETSNISRMRLTRGA